MKPEKIPKVLLVIKPVDGGSACIGLIECPNCGQEHLTTNLACGERRIFCGDGYSWIDIERII